VVVQASIVADSGSVVPGDVPPYVYEPPASSSMLTMGGGAAHPSSQHTAAAAGAASIGFVGVDSHDEYASGGGGGGSDGGGGGRRQRAKAKAGAAKAKAKGAAKKVTPKTARQKEQDRARQRASQPQPHAQEILRTYGFATDASGQLVEVPVAVPAHVLEADIAKCVELGFNRAIAIGWLSVAEVQQHPRGAAEGALDHLLRGEVPPG
jgi:hypothetical protein